SSDNGVLFNKDGTELLAYPAGKTASSYAIPEDVTTIGNYAFYGCTSLTSVTVPEGVLTFGNYAFSVCTSLADVTVANGLKTVGNYAFSVCTSLTSVSLPGTVTTIGSNAFEGCTSLASIVIPRDTTTIGDFAFHNCTSLASVTLSDSVVSISHHAFDGCKALPSITITKNVATLGSLVFYGCTSLTSIDVSEDNENYSSYEGVLFNKDGTELWNYPVGRTDSSYTIPDGVKSTVMYAFRCSSVTDVVVPEGFTSFGVASFYGCTSLKSVNVPDSVTTIDSLAFYGCTSLESITLPDGVTTIESGAFYLCTSLTEISIPKTVTRVGDSAFIYCTSLTSIDVSKDSASYSSDDGVLFNADKTRLMQYPIGRAASSYTIPASVESVVLDAFYCCVSLTEILVDAGNGNYCSEDGVLYTKDMSSLVMYPEGKTASSYTMPDTVESIGACALLGCTSLMSIDVPESSTSYKAVDGILYDKSGEHLIRCPAGIESLIVPSNTTVIEEYAFSGNIKEVRFVASGSISVKSNSFMNCNNLEKIIIDDGADVTFSPRSLTYVDFDEHTIYVVAPKGYPVTFSAVNDNITVIYGEPPAEDSGNDFPVLYVGIGAVAVLAIIGVVFLIRRR
ncbi:MAG: leucine-rich repeat protein, partial [Candidatus Methanomethylophilaceae archaeon]